MSLPSTGRVRARVKGESVFFNGVEWSEGPPVLVMLLNEFTPSHLRTHVTAAGAAQRILTDLGREWEITHAVCDEWDTELPEGAID